MNSIKLNHVVKFNNNSFKYYEGGINIDMSLLAIGFSTGFAIPFSRAYKLFGF